jgi:hypothetical protein
VEDALVDYDPKHGDDQDMAELLVAPYLPNPGMTVVGSWQLMPFGSIGDADGIPVELRRAVCRLVDAYQVDDIAGLGAIAFPADAQVGVPLAKDTIRPLARALLAGVIADNPPMCVREEDAPANAGHMVATAENAAVWGHPLLDGDSYATETGVLARVADLRHSRPDEPLPKIHPPIELPKPLFGHFDAEVADATHRLLTGRNTMARRLSRALDWYAVTLSNAEAVTVDVRIGAARTALEVLTGSGDETKKLVRHYGMMVGTEEAPKTTFDDVPGFKGPVQLTPDELWMARLCELRNAIVHGDEIDDELWHHDGHHQLDQVHDRLIMALKVQVADASDDGLLRLRLGDRVFPRLDERPVEVARREEEGIDSTQDRADD